ncbi:hypothetical protein PO909_005144 [Leuciscus waleckii]
MSTHTKSGRRTVLQDNSWIRRKAEEDEPIDDDPNFGKVVLSQKKPVDDVSSKSVEAEKTPVNSGTTFSKSPASVNTSISAIVPPPTPAPKPPVPAKNPVLKTPNTSSFNARVFSGANSSSKTLSPVKPSFGEKFPELTASQTTNGAVKSSSVSSPVKTSTRSESVSVSTLKSSTPLQSQSESVSVSTLKSSTPPKSQSESVSVSTLKSSTPPQSQSESVSVSTLKSSTPPKSQSESVSVSTLKSSTPLQSQTTVTNTKTSSALDESLSSRPAEKHSARYSPSAVTLNTHSSSQTASAPLDDLADSLLSGRVQSQPVRSQTTVTNTKTSSALDESLSSRPAEKHSARTQVRTVHTEIPASSPTLRSPLQTLQSSRVSSRDTCTVCGKPIAGDGRMILEELNIISHTSCFRCAVCRCDLGGLEAGKSLWVLRERVHCSNCFSNIRGQWYI